MARLPALVALLASLLPAQQTLIVGPSGYADLDQAWRAALPGDRILIRTPVTHFTALTGKGVRILGDLGRPVVHARASSAGPARIALVPPTETFLLSGVDLLPTCLSAACATGLAIEDCPGNVQFHDVHVPLKTQRGPVLFGQSLVVARCASVHFHRCELTGQNGSGIPSTLCGSGTDALEVDASNVAISLGRVLGGDGPDPFVCSGRTGLGLRATASHVTCAGVASVTGGRNGGPWDVALTGATIVDHGARTYIGSGTIYAYGWLPAISGNFVVHHDPRPLPVVTGDVRTASVDLAITQVQNGSAVFLLGIAPLYLPGPGLVHAGTLLVSPLAPAVVFAAGPGYRTQIPVSPALLLALRHETVLVTSVVLDAGELRAGSADLVRF